MKDMLEEYFDWLYDKMTNRLGSRRKSYHKLFTALFDKPFTCSSKTSDFAIAYDFNRLEDGLNLRKRFADEYGYSREIVEKRLNIPCSILEVMCALAIRCEETLMDDPKYGDRTGQWFWDMVRSLGLLNMDDARFDGDFTETVLDRFLKREYTHDGRGGLFYIRGSIVDLRRIEIWYQLCRYIDAYYRN